VAVPPPFLLAGFVGNTRSYQTEPVPGSGSFGAVNEDRKARERIERL